jgi:capsular exopolysaccharide synthesis family protein
MSKNLELMQDAQIRIGERASTAIPAAHKTNGNGKAAAFSLESEMVREESAKLVQNIFLLRPESRPRVVAFAGIDSGNGCTWICAKTAEILANRKAGSVCIVDANLRTPALPEFFGVGNHYGLTDALTKTGEVREFVKPVGAENLWLLSGGSMGAESTGLLNSEVMRKRVSELREEFDFVLIDSPPLNHCFDGFALGQLADGLVLVLEANSTRREAAAKATECLRAANIKILGAVLNKRTFPIPRFLYQRL